MCRILIFVCTLNSGANAEVLRETTSGYNIEISAGVVEGTDILAGAEGVYYKFTGSPAPSAGQSTTNPTTERQGSSISIKDDKNELYFQRINPRTETRMSISHATLLQQDIEFKRSVFFSKSNVSYAFESGIGVLIDPARLDHFNIQVGGEIALSKILQTPPLGELILSIKSGVAHKISKTRLHSALIDVHYKNSKWIAHYGLGASVRPLNKIPLALTFEFQRDSNRDLSANLRTTYELRF